MTSLARRSIVIALITLFASVTAFAFTTVNATTLQSDGSSSDTQAAINASATGFTVLLPAGTFTWTSGVTISGKAVKLQGSGSGRVVACSDSAITVGPGTKIFTLKVESVASIAALRSAVTTGVTLRIWRNGGNHANGVFNGTLSWMEGTVASLVGNTLTMNITATSGSGTQGNWIFVTPAATTLRMNFISSQMLNLTESTVAGMEVSGVRFEHVTGLSATVDTQADFIVLNTTSGGYPVSIHDNAFFNFTYGLQIHGETSKGIIWNNSFVSLPFAGSALALHFVLNSNGATWSTPSTFGALDTTGKNNVYVEDCDFHAWNNATDYDSNLRSVMRYCLFDSAAFGTHGPDSSPFGQRHFEVYNCEFRRTDFNDGQTMPVGWCFLIRGGTGVITDNVASPYAGQDYPNGPACKLALWNLNLNVGPNPLWGKNIPGVQYPCPRQIGQGYIDGTGVDGMGRSSDGTAFVGDLEPIYIWNNTGTTLNVFASQAQPPSAGEDSVGDYVVSGQAYKFNAGAKPGYTKYTYPHPFRAGGVIAPAITTQPAAQSITTGSTATFTTAASGLPAPTFQWRKNGAAISGATNASFVITGVVLTDAGSYSVVATNSAGSVTSATATLNIRPAEFDVTAYYARNPAIAATYATDYYGAWLYYRNTGIYAGETFDEIFRIEEYLALYPELFALFGTDLGAALEHWLTTGKFEGRLGRIPTGFSAPGYFARNPDVAAAVKNDPLLGWEHFWLYGIYEGRAFDEEFRVFEYLAINADLQAAFLSDWRAGTLHWLRYGRTEGRLGRIPLNFSSTEYLRRYPEVAVAWGTYPTTVWLHFWLYGIDEGRTFDEVFRVDEYLALNPDLVAVFGTNRRGAFTHWVRYGQAEGRPGRNP